MPRNYLACLSVVAEKDTGEVANPTDGACDITGVFRHDRLLQCTTLLRRDDPEHGLGQLVWKK